VSRQTKVVLVIGALIGAAALASFSIDFGGAEPVPPPAPVQPARDIAAPTPAPEPVAEPVAPRPSRPGSPKKAVSTPAPTMPEAPTTATLHITSDVPDAQVFIDRKFIGTAPVTAEDVAPGTRQINVSAPGYDGVLESVEVAPGPRDVMISLKAIRLDESIAVTHKHRFGSCAGRLIATPDGLSYETDNKDDGFKVPLNGIETFKADFLAKNLKVKIKGGRTYDFTDPGGKADPLYLFHQSVDKARLKQGSGKGPAQGGR
jgi:hypothetical protein